MSEYTLEIKQIVDYPRCRIYRQFVQALIADRSIRVSGGSGLFWIRKPPALPVEAPRKSFSFKHRAKRATSRSLDKRISHK